jgi:hypothetical protein
VKVIVMDSERLKTTIRENANELVRLHALIHETYRNRGEGALQRAQWQAACDEFHAQYSDLAFPGGYEGALDRISSGEPLAMEAGLCFLECRPYFFRSGYMYKDILRRLKRAPLSELQASRLRLIQERLKEWRAGRDRSNAPTLEQGNREG